MKKLNQRKVKWIIREIDKEQKSVYRIAKTMDITPQWARELHHRFHKIRQYPYPKKSGRKPRPISEEEKKMGGNDVVVVSAVRIPFGKFGGVLKDIPSIELGAMVIKIESSTRTDTLRQTPPFQENKPGINRSGWFAKYNTNKYGISLNLSHPKARPIVEKLVRWADIVIESFTPGVIKKWHLGYEEMAQIKPDIIMMSTSAQGQTGPRAQQPSYGVQLTSLAGLANRIPSFPPD
jgi:hypothetical protein